MKKGALQIDNNLLSLLFNYRNDRQTAYRIQEIKKRLLESICWQLREGMSQEKVKELLGPPQHIEDGSISIWRYTNGGSITFMGGKVFSWSEPL
ncbi:hypothetical protein ACKGJO_10910 [Gracilimonas sp. Q87]|uniref:hypothetical protein n=1 Tax=Gracilimonas sp. Q87 TaxID=3384766 RepID=UPI0039842455